ncbi:MAG: protein CsuE [Candidatus Sphingomonas phytovorans]|nr:protein CsuE [Sphingomonas sp.]WEK00050.1 MAG: protein CsuE [Sphingomonas sp.]
MRTVSASLKYVASAIAVWLALLAAPALACTLSPNVTTTLGTYSPAAVKAGVVPGLQTRAGIVCPTSVLVLLGSNYIRAKFTSQNNFKLKLSGGTATANYIASADPAGTYRFAQGATLDYMQNNLLNLLGLLGGSSADLPFYVTPSSTAVLAPGTYTDTITIHWDWNLCPGIGALGLCIGVPDTGSGDTTITVTLVVSPLNVVTTISSLTTWDGTNGTSRPKTIPGSRRRLTAAVSNPDIVPLDTGTLAIIVPTPAGSLVALDGDGTSSGTVFSLTEGSPASTVTLRYGGPSDGTDDVDFSSDGAISWTYTPIAGNPASEGAVTHVRIRPEGAMAKQSSFSVSLPYLLK